MRLFGFGGKIDKNIKPYLNINSRRAIPVILCYKSNFKLIKNKILSAGGKIKYEYQNVNAVSCELSPFSIDKISEIPEVSFICFDYKASLCLRKSKDMLGIKHATTFNLTGKGIGIGLVDTGIYPHPDLTVRRNAIAFFKDLINGYNSPYDDNGHGTFMAGLIASSGHMSSQMYTGVAPGANILCIKAFDSAGKGFVSDIIKAIDILVSVKDTYNMKVLCLPFELPGLEKLKTNPMEDIIKKAISLGITVIAPAGNLGPQPYSIYFPGNINEVITVGGASTLDGNIKNISICSFSGRGPTLSGLAKPDISAPAHNVISLLSDTLYTPSERKNVSLKTYYTTMSGTSISCALISGICTLILEKTPGLTPQDLKSILCLSTISIGENKFSQGKGLFIFDKIIK
ncbi:S8 family serine peptidase [Fonticella tunisiensis]|uniref:Serine protease AprX n=1 Tax=Fonticella tunisiensis TaxID=1096341 RepID=A0A4R7KT99_9CLOT|nr:S8 family serine peptidase [Fonticella tunisiensis]TDT63249.1 serine protease AprX [Fonticella tunisiensis]